MRKLYAKWMYDWEDRLCSRATDRKVRPFEWGLEWTRDWPVSRDHPQNGHDSHSYLRLLNRAALESSDSFFSYETPADFELQGNLLRFTSAVELRIRKTTGCMPSGFRPYTSRARGA